MNKGIRPADIAGINRWIEVAERDQEDQNARARGFTPFASWQECSPPVTVDIPAGGGLVLVQHQLVNRMPQPVTPTDYLVTQATGPYTLYAVGLWSPTTATFETTSAIGARLRIVFWRA